MSTSLDRDGVSARLIDALLEHPPEGREAWIDALAEDYAPFKPQLRAIAARAAALDAAGFLSTLPACAPAEHTPATDRVGPYRLVRELGRGGMGAVFLAEAEAGLVRRPVALKLPHRAWNDKGFAERLARERDILAALNHPHVARLYDAGVTADGQPYLALEHVEGQRIDAYCQARALDVRARLSLFLQVIDAVAHAHAKLVVHRDLKPANILVTAEGQVKLLDFGIAKLLSDEGHDQLTQRCGRALTPDYAAPEQLAEGPITIRADVYALGVVLYELLAGTRPYRRDPRRGDLTVMPADPPPPSAHLTEARARRAVRGDLDTIVLKALKKNPDDRYPTAHALADDIGRFLAGRPVLAQPDTAWYRLRRFTARHRLAVIAGAAAAAAIVVGGGVSLWQAQVALAEARRAEQVKELVVAMMNDVDPHGEAGKVLTAVELLERCRARVEGMREIEPEARVELLNTIAWSLILAETRSAESVAQEALDAASALPGEHPQRLRARLLRALAYRMRGGASPAVRSELDEVIALLRKNTHLDTRHLVLALRNRANAAITEGRPDEALQDAREATALALRRFGAVHTETIMSGGLLAVVQRVLKQPAALESAEAAFRGALALHPGNPSHPLVITERGIYGQALVAAGHLERGLAELSRALQDGLEVLGGSWRTVGTQALQLAEAQRAAGFIDAARETGDLALRTAAPNVRPDSHVMAVFSRAQGEILLAADRPAEALPLLTRADAIFEQLRGPLAERSRVTRALRALALARLGQTAAARDLIDGLLAQQLSDDDATWVALHALGVVERREGHPAHAAALQEIVSTALRPDQKVERDAALRELALSRAAMGQRRDVAQARATPPEGALLLERR